MSDTETHAGAPNLPSTALSDQIRALLHRPRPSLYGVRPYKAAFVADLGPKVAATAFAAAAGWGDGWTGVPRRLQRLREYACIADPRFEELSPPQDLVAPPLVGVDGIVRPAMPVRTRSFFFCELADATVFSKSNFVLCDGQALFDVEQGEQMEIPLQLDVDPAVIAHEGESLWFMQPPPDRKPLYEACALSLLGVHSFAFGHWICEFLPKVWACMQRPELPAFTLLIDEQMPPQHLEALRLCVGADHPIRVVPPGAHVQVGRLWFCSMPSYFPVGPRPDIEYRDGLLTVDPVAYTRLLEQALPRMVPPRTEADTRLPKRVYLARRDSQHRPLANRVEVEAVFRAHGFAVVDFRDVPFREQLRYVRAADVVAGPDGSAFMTTYFGRHDLRILTLANPRPSDYQMYSLVCAARRQPYFVLPGEYAGPTAGYAEMTGYAINVPVLERMLARLLAGDTLRPER